MFKREKGTYFVVHGGVMTSSKVLSFGRVTFEDAGTETRVQTSCKYNQHKHSLYDHSDAET
jgi:hypothetical protein